MKPVLVRLACALLGLSALPVSGASGLIIVPGGASLGYVGAGPAGSLALGCADIVIQGSVSLGSATVGGVGNLSISTGGSLDAGSSTLSIGGNWTNAGTFTAGSSTISFGDGCSPSAALISGPTAFANLSLSSGTGRTFTIPTGAAIAVAGVLRATGTAQRPIQIASVDASQPSYIALGANATVIRENVQLAANVFLGKPSFALSLSKSGAGSGAVNSTPAGISCDGSCNGASANFELGTTVTLTASAAAGSTFAGWSGASCSGTGTCQLTMDAAKNVTAQFSVVVNDTTPDAFFFTSQTGVIPGAVVQSNTVTITGINAPAPISITGGSYSIGCNNVFTAAGGTIQTGQTVCLRLAASSQPSSTSSATLTVGGVAGAFSVTTSAPLADTTAPQIISGPFVTGLSANSATVSWLTNEEATSELTFSGGTLSSNLYRTSHVLTLSGLAAGAPVIVSVRSVDRAGNVSASKSLTFTTTATADTTPPAFLEGPVVVGISTDRATIKWKTDEAATSVVTGGATGVVPGFRTEHEVSLTNLASATRYSVTILSADSANNAAAPRSVSFTTLAAPDTTPPQIVKGPLVVDVGSDYLTVAWDTDEGATSRLSVDGGGQSLVRADDATKTSHRLRVGGLLPSTTYQVRVSSIDAFGNGPTVSQAVSITTAAARDTAAPVFTEAVSVCQVGDTFLLLCFRTDEPSSASVAYGLSGGALNLSASRASLLQAQTLSVTGLAPGTAYQLRVTVTDAAANSATGTTLTATTAAAAPPPLQITSGPRIAWATVDRVVVTWTTSRPATSVVEYGTTAFDRQVSDGQLTSEHSIVVTGLTAGATYQFRVSSTDVAGLSVQAEVGATAAGTAGFGAPSAGGFTVPVTPDTTPPVFTQAPLATSIGGTSARITWTTNELGDAVVRYGTSATALTSIASDIEFATTHSVALTKLAPNTTYYYQVTTADPVGNTSTAQTLSFRTIESTPSASGSETSVAFGAQAVGSPTSARTVTVTNTGGAALTVASATSNNEQFAVANGCSQVAAGANCAITVTFTPTALGTRTGSLAIVTNGGNLTVALTGVGVASPSAEANANAVVTGYYETILQRSPDAGGKAYWAGEASRVSQLGADIKEAFFAMSIQFFSSAEYLGRSTSDEQYIRDLYRTFFSREADGEGLAYWVGELSKVQSRSALLNSFLFSAEFSELMVRLFGATPVRPEVNVTMDLFRGTFGRLPDSPGFNYWLGEIRKAQCAGASAVSARVNEIGNLFFGGAEYVGRSRLDRDFIGDVYNTYLRRGPGGDSGGFNYWVSEIPKQGRDAVRGAFVPSAEFQSRVGGVVAAGCLQ